MRADIFYPRISDNLKNATESKQANIQNKLSVKGWLHTD